jgi:sugar lactone lactonase YvrE
VGERRLLVDTGPLGGLPDGGCADGEGGVWTCVLGPGTLVRHASHDGTDAVITTGVELPSDVTFGGAGLDRMFFVSIAVDLPGVQVTSPNAGRLMRIDNSGFRGRPEPRMRM